jgi:predicted unusual protein kinase regulating ubiquinone biosynthesis (AarF/ABC1/UbiB family)
VRIAKTLKVLSETGVGWLLGDRPPAPQLLRKTFERLGTTYIKLGQFIASSPSLFPDEYVNEFQHCLDNTPALPFSTIKDVLKSELKQPLHTLFSDISPTPLASASIAQVHAAKLITGEDVVIKVQKPGVNHILLTDLNFLYLSAKLLELIAPRLQVASLSEIVDEMQKSMLAECDFHQEAQNIADFQAFLDETHNTEVVVPKVYPHASSLKVLTMERFFGISFTDLEKVKQYSPDPQYSLITAMNTWFSTLLLGKPFHADVHAGNLLILENGKVGFIDFGIVGKIRSETWASITLFIDAITHSDYLGMANAMVGIGVTQSEINIDALADDIQQIYENMDQLQNTTTHGQAINDNDINQVMTNIIYVGKQYGIHFPREFALLLKQVLYFDRYVQLLAPDMGFYSDKRLMMMPELPESTQQLSHQGPTEIPNL